MNKKIFMLSMLLSFFCLKSRATVVYVDVANTSGVEDGTSWASAYSKLQLGINAANYGDSVWVARGEYHTDSFFAMKEGVKIFGGFVNTDIIFEQQNWITKETRLVGGTIVNLQNGLTPSALLDGFTVLFGGGIFNFESSPTFRNCIIRSNTAAFNNVRGGAMLNMNANPVIVNCLFSSNRASDGGAIFNDHSSPNIINCVFYKNEANQIGKEIANTNESFPNIVNCTFYKSKGRAYGVIFNSQGSIVQLSNSIIWASDTGIFNLDSSNAIIKYSLIQNMAADAANHNLDGSLNPLLTETSTTYYHLDDNSPCIDKGSNEAYVNAGGDLQSDFGKDGNPRLVGDIIDMGASENPNASTGIKELANQLQKNFTIHPNPAKEIIHINITEPKLLHTQAFLTDIYGRIIRSVMIENRYQPLSLAGLTSSIYIIKMENGAAVKIVKE